MPSLLSSVSTRPSAVSDMWFYFTSPRTTSPVDREDPSSKRALNLYQSAKTYIIIRRRATICLIFTSDVSFLYYMSPRTQFLSWIGTSFPCGQPVSQPTYILSIFFCRSSGLLSYLMYPILLSSSVSDHLQLLSWNGKVFRQGEQRWR